MKRFLIALGAVATTATGAAAADLTAPLAPEFTAGDMSYADVARPGYDWTGVYAGVVGGYAHSETATGDVSFILSNGATLGVTAGANVQMDQFVLGAEGDVVWSGGHGAGSCGAGVTCTVDMKWLGTLRGRAGFAYNSLLLYGTAGLAVGHGDSEVSPKAGGTTGFYGDTFYGWTVGVGAEYALTDRMTLKTEIDYADLGTRTAPAGSVGTVDLDVHPYVTTAKAGVNYKF